EFGIPPAVRLGAGLVASRHGNRAGAAEERAQRRRRAGEALLPQQQHADSRRLDDRVPGRGVEGLLVHVDAEGGPELPVEPAHRWPRPIAGYEVVDELRDAAIAVEVRPPSARVEERRDRLRD